MKFSFKYLLLISLFFMGSFFSCSKKMMVVSYPEKKPLARQLNQAPSVALVLGGGAFHGLAHVGVIKVLENAGIPIDIIIGTSAGSLIGALYADKISVDSILPLMKTTKSKDIFDFSLFRSRTGFVSGKRLQKFLCKHLSVSEIEQTKIPFIAVVTDIEQGKSVALDAGPIAPSVNASCAIPGVFDPVKMYGSTFVDGGILNNIPVDVAIQLKSQYIIAVNIMELKDTANLNNYKDILMRSFMVSLNQHSENNLKLADMVITPNLKGIPYMSSKDNDKIFQLGVQAANDVIEQIKKDLKAKKILISN